MYKKTLHNNPKKNSKSTNSKQVDHYTVCFMFYLLKSNSKYQNTLLDGEIIKLLKRLFLNQFRNIFSLSVTKYSSTRAIQQHSKHCSSPRLCDRRSTKYTPQGVQDSPTVPNMIQFGERVPVCLPIIDHLPNPDSHNLHELVLYT